MRLIVLVLVLGIVSCKEKLTDHNHSKNQKKTGQNLTLEQVFQDKGRIFQFSGEGTDFVVFSEENMVYSISFGCLFEFPAKQIGDTVYIFWDYSIDCKGIMPRLPDKTPKGSEFSKVILESDSSLRIIYTDDLFFQEILELNSESYDSLFEKKLFLRHLITY